MCKKISLTIFRILNDLCLSLYRFNFYGFLSVLLSKNNANSFTLITLGIRGDSRTKHVPWSVRKGPRPRFSDEKYASRVPFVVQDFIQRLKFIYESVHVWKI